MNDLAPVDRDFHALLAAFPSFTLSEQSLPALRAASPQSPSADKAAAQARGVRLEELSIPGMAGAPAVRLLAYWPHVADRALPAFLQIHGGGYVMGSADMMDAANRETAAELNCGVFAVDYRLAPETPFPGPLDDCYAALTYLIHNADKLGLDAQRIGIKGESAGGGLAAAVALRARDVGDVSPAFLHLIFPMLDDRTGAPGEERHAHAGGLIWSYDSNQFGWRSMLGQTPGGANTSAYAAPARADRLECLPPTYISCGALDIFLDENLEFARRLVRAGVAVTFKLYPAVPHGFMILLPDATVSREAERDTNEALRRAMNP